MIYASSYYVTPRYVFFSYAGTVAPFVTESELRIAKKKLKPISEPTFDEFVCAPNASPIHVSSYCYICVLMLLSMCVLVLLYVSSYYYMCSQVGAQRLALRASKHFETRQRRHPQQRRRHAQRTWRAGKNSGSSSSSGGQRNRWRAARPASVRADAGISYIAVCI
jgi:hypothetical protein